MRDDTIKKMAEAFRKADAHKKYMQYLNENPQSPMGRRHRLIMFLITMVMFGGAYMLVLAAANWLDINVVAAGATWMSWKVYIISGVLFGASWGWMFSRPS